MSAYLQTGQTTCHDEQGLLIPCDRSGQDAEFRLGIPWSAPCFEISGETALCLAVAGYLWFIQGDMDKKISGRGKN